MSEHRIVIDRLTDYKYFLHKDALIITFDDYRDKSLLEEMFINGEYIEITIKTYQFHYVVYIDSVYIDKYQTKMSLCKYQTTECTTIFDSNTISVYYHGDRVCINSKCFDVQKTYPVEIVFKVKSYNESQSTITYRFTLKEIAVIQLSVDALVMSAVIVVSIASVFYLLQNIYKE